MNAKYWKEFLIPANTVNCMDCLAPFPKVNPAVTTALGKSRSAEAKQQQQHSGAPWGD